MLNVVPQPSAVKKVAKIIAEGSLSSRSKEYRVIESRLVAEARLRYAQALKGASLLKRVRLELAIQREVQAELKKRFPSHALYGVARNHS